MSYQVLARKWRPRVFGELVGQAHVVRALSNALDNDRLHHAYLFTGTRGVGKTTLARIFAKSLNCEHGVGSAPCGQCSACREIDEGRFVDLLEVDAASRTKVDQTRELLENVPYAPARGRYKVYLIDEVHMFSDSSFNALLKTLEEPPPHVKFLLATTDPQKVPVTVLSRCLQFNLKRLPLDQIQGQLQHILEREAIEFDPAALVLLSRGADGSMRDALSLLDQAIAFSGGRVMEPEVRSMLGSIALDRVHNLVSALADSDAGGLLDQVAQLAEMAPDFSGLLQELLSLLHRIALVQVVESALDDSLGDRETVLDLARRMAPEDVQLYYQIGLIGQRELPLAPDPRAGFEMLLLRMLAFRPVESVGGDLTVASSKETTTPRPATASTPAARPGESRPTQSAVTSRPAKQPEVQTPAEPAVPALPRSLDNWREVVESLRLGGMATQLANNCVLDSWDGKLLKLGLDPAHQHLQTAKASERLQQALVGYLGCELRLEFIAAAAREVTGTPAQQQALAEAERQREAERSMQHDPLVQGVVERFGGRLIPDSVRPVEES